MASKKKVAPPSDEATQAADAEHTQTTPATPAVEAHAAKKAKAHHGPIVVKHRDHRGETVERTFSADTHGEHFAKVADEFKTTNAHLLVPEE
jgi:hypothetical protein